MIDPLDPRFTNFERPEQLQAWQEIEDELRAPKRRPILAYVALWAIVILALLSLPSWAQTCAPRDQVIAKLAGTYGEEQSYVAMSEGGLVEMYVSPTTGTWTFLLAKPDGSACLIASGKEWGGPLAPKGKPV
jgi:hypothetical protein